MAQIFISHADWGLREIANAITGVFSTTGRRATLRKELQRALSEISGREAHVVDSGRSALRLSLEVIGAQHAGRREVIVPSYVCPAVPMTVTALGLVPIYADVGPDLNATAHAIERQMSVATLAVVLPHMYGSPADVTSVEDLCRARGISLIDDAAQVVGETCDGRMLGTFGDFGILSFAQSKGIVCGLTGSGGAVLVNNAAFSERLARKIRHLPVARGSLKSKLTFASTLIAERLGPDAVYYWSRFRGLLRGASREPDPMQVTSISDIDASIALTQLKRLDAIRAARRRIVELYGESINQLGGCEFPQYARDRFLSRIMLATPEGASAAEIRERLRRRGFGSRPGYPIYGDAGTAPRAAAFRDRLFEAPSFPGMRQRDIDSFCNLLAAVLAEHDEVPVAAAEQRNGGALS